MVYTESSRKELRKDNINIALNLQSERSHSIELFGTLFNKITFNLDELFKKFEKVESSLPVSQKANSSLITRLHSLER